MSDPHQHRPRIGSPPARVAEAAALRSANARLRETLAWVLAGHRRSTSEAHVCLLCRRLVAALAEGSA